MTRILLVDEDPAYRDAARSLLEGAGYSVEEAEDAAEALSIMWGVQPEFVLLNVSLPQVDGLEMLRRMRADEAMATIPVVLVSANHDPGLRVTGLELGANDFVQKGCDSAELLARVRAHLRVASMVPRAMPSSSPSERPAPTTRLSAQQGKEQLLLDGRYEIDGVLGEGGMGKVYRATHVALGRPVAIKVMSNRARHREKLARRLEREAKLAGTLEHPNICQIYDMGRLDDGSPYLVMERLEGKPLSERIYLEGAMSFSDSLTIVQQVLSALEAAHDSGILHRDIKPDNVFLTVDASARLVAKILDFGVAKFVQSTSLDSAKGRMLGTPAYMAPEQFVGESTDARTDLYACGVLLYEMSTGRPPFAAKDVDELGKLVMETPPPDPRKSRPRTPDALVAAIFKAMEKAPSDRYQTAGEFLQDVRSLRSAELRAVGLLGAVRPSLSSSQEIPVFHEPEDG